jgi:Protein of unknown function (DUF4236)
MRFRKSIKLAPGVRLNLSRSGVSTTLGGRGVSVNIGKRGTRATVGIPGTGLSFSQRVGGGSGGASNQGATNAGGCAGVGCLGFFVLVLLGMCVGPESPSSSYPSASSLGTYTAGTYTTPAAASSVGEGREWFYIHGTLNVRAEPNKHAAIVRTLHRGDFVQLGPKDANGWARLYGTGSTDGYVYRASDLVQRRAPAARSLSSGYGGASSSSSGGSRSSGSSRRSSGGRRLSHGTAGRLLLLQFLGQQTVRQSLVLQLMKPTATKL